MSFHCFQSIDFSVGNEETNSHILSWFAYGIGVNVFSFLSRERFLSHSYSLLRSDSNLIASVYLLLP